MALKVVEVWHGVVVEEHASLVFVGQGSTVHELHTTLGLFDSILVAVVLELLTLRYLIMDSRSVKVKGRMKYLKINVLFRSC